MRIVAAAQVAPVRWQNGGGLTRELLALPAGGGWGLRISVADIAADGPFSSFPGVTRWFAVLEGAGVRLAWPGRAALDVRPGDAPLRFDGADAPGCALLGGPTRDLNVMLRDGFGRATLTPCRAGEEMRIGLARALGVFATRPLRLRDGGGSVDLPPLSLAWIDTTDTAPRAWWVEDPTDELGRGAHTGEPPAARGPLGWWIQIDAADRA